ncbi:hypothetical protein [Ulvibacter litoralis]|uniref:Uncharacterized protein n=1 Tax=Ulvibacter litoralis TaxID=227084 RepID=A0A1G7EZF8_9FLAO|nr:hypothetical protein [Ulvibacter litoralis]GHC53326.1 hypothetical protein GCM10008083_16650 [Ulvibacter litoralis]SDE69039.1 hypothetical protein SAMN05421855_102234 [Ulvibacter litoralis]
MDNLELLKKQWQSREQELPKLSYTDIHKMLLKKSSSIVKWIFLISIGELLFWTILAFFVPESSKAINDSIGLKTTFMVVNIVHYIIFAGFIYLFYKNYHSIKVTDTIKELMRSILNTRKTVKYFVFYNVGASILLMLAVNMFYFTKKDQLYKLMVQNYEGYGAIPQESFTSVFFISQLVISVVFVGLIILFYRVIYGILLKRLKRNYCELEKIEV